MTHTTNVIVELLRHVQATQGSAAMARHGQAIITASCSILSREHGLDFALAALKDAGIAVRAISSNDN